MKPTRKTLGESMRETIERIREKLKSFVEDGDDSYFGTDVNSLHYQMVNSYPRIPDVKYVLEELHSYSNKLSVADTDADRQKYYQLSLGRLMVLETKAEQAGAL